MNLQHVKNDSSRAMGINISLGKAGLISFSKEAKNSLKLENGSKIMFLQDTDKPRDWYLSICEDGDNSIRFFKEGMCGFNSSSIIKRIKNSLENYDNKTIKIPLGKPFESHGKILIALLTAKLG